MSNEIFLMGSEGGDAARDAIRALYAPPSSPAYWDGLHARIMARIGEESDAWWVVLSQWTRAGLAAAAAVVLMAAGAAAIADRDAEARDTYELVIMDTPAPQSTLDRILDTPGISESEATYQFLLPR